MKRIIYILAAVLVFLSSFAFMVSAAGTQSANPKRFADNAGIIDDSAEAEISKLLDEISEKRKFDVAVLTVASTEGKDPMIYADDYYDSTGLGYGKNRDGILLLISMDPRYIWVSTCGKGLKVIPDSEIDYFIDTFYDDIAAGDFASACRSFAVQADSEAASFNMRPVYLIPVALIIGFIASLVSVSSMKSKHNTVRFKPEASTYGAVESLALINQSDNCLYTNVSRMPVQTQVRTSSGGGTHVSSGGMTHGGGGRSF